MITRIREGMSGQKVAEIIDSNFDYLENKQNTKFDQQDIYIDGKLSEYEQQIKDLTEQSFIKVDEEDLTVEDGAAKFNDREYTATTDNGKGYKILRRRLYHGHYLLMQSDFDQTNTIYVVRYKFTLNGNIINLPDNCVIQFEGGNISNGTLNLNGALVEPINQDMSEYFAEDLTVTGFKAGQTFYDKEIEALKTWDGEDWTNVDGTLISKVIIV